jgi:hypothetical protein
MPTACPTITDSQYGKCISNMYRDETRTMVMLSVRRIKVFAIAFTGLTVIGKLMLECLASRKLEWLIEANAGSSGDISSFLIVTSSCSNFTTHSDIRVRSYLCLGMCSS